MKAATVLVRLVCFSPREFVLCVVFGFIVFVAVPVALGFATQALFDALATGPVGLNAWSAVALLVGVQVADLFASPALGNPWNGLQQRAQALLRRNLFADILRGNGRHGLRAPVGEAISAFRDDPEFIADGLDALCDLIGRSVFAVIAAVVMWRINATLTVVLIVPLLATSVLMEALGNTTIAYRAASRVATSRVTGYIGELLLAQAAVRVGGGLPHALARLEMLSEQRQRMAVRDSVFGELLDSLCMNLAHVGAGAVLLLGAERIRAGDFGVGDFALFVLFLDQLVWYPAEIGRLINDLKRTSVSMQRMHALAPGEPTSALVATAPVYLDGKLPELLAPPTAVRARLERLDVVGLTCVHPCGVHGIVDVSFTLERGSFTVITGPIGSGKTTLVQALVGLLPRSRGEIRWNGCSVDDPAAFLVPPRVAYTPQLPRLFSDSLRNNILLGWSADADAIDRAVHAAVLERDVRLLEHGLETVVGPRGVKLSGGQVQRAAAARMFVREPELLILDDISSALDGDTEAELWRRLFARSRDLTCLVVSHRPAALKHADQVLVLEAGRLHQVIRSATQVQEPSW